MLALASHVCSVWNISDAQFEIYDRSKIFSRQLNEDLQTTM
jgi:hypothetical protein